MKSRLFLPFLLMALTWVTSSIHARKNILVSSMTCEIQGHTSPSCPDTIAYLMSASGQEEVCLDSSSISDRQFHFSIAACDTPYVAYVVLRHSLPTGIPLMIDADVLDLNWNKTEACYQVSGSPANEELSSLSSHLLQLLRTRQDSISLNYPFPLSPTGWSLGKSFIYKTLQSNTDNILGLFLLTQCSQMMGVTNADKYFSRLPTLLSNLDTYKNLARYIESEKRSIEGDDYHHLSLLTTAGDTVQLADFCNDGQFTVFCFWESDHPACLAEMPGLSRVFKDFDGKGIEVIGVSLDKDAHLWHQSVNNLQLPFRQLWDFRQEARQVYGILSLPMVIVISPNFRILRKNIFGQELYDACRSWAY